MKIIRGFICFCLTFAIAYFDANQSAADEFVIHKDPDPSFNTAQTTGWDGGEVDPGAVVFHNGLFHMFYNGMVRAFQTHSIGYATSKDGRRWRRMSDLPVLTLEDTGHKGGNIIANSAVVEDDGTWVMYLSIASGMRGYLGYVIRAAAATPMGPWKTDAEPVLMPGGENEWDGRSVGHVSVNRVGAKYFMHYTGLGSIKVENFLEDHSMTGLATSNDGIHWEKYDDPVTKQERYINSDPIMRVDESPGSWEKWHLHDVNVQIDAGVWSMIYRSSTRNEASIGFATSSDGINWERYPHNPIANRRDVKEQGIWFTSYVRHNKIDYVWFEAGWIDNTRIYLMTRP